MNLPMPATLSNGSYTAIIDCTTHEEISCPTSNCGSQGTRNACYPIVVRDGWNSRGICLLSPGIFSDSRGTEEAGEALAKAFSQRIL